MDLTSEDRTISHYLGSLAGALTSIPSQLGMNARIAPIAALCALFVALKFALAFVNTRTGRKSAFTSLIPIALLSVWYYLVGTVPELLLAAVLCKLCSPTLEDYFTLKRSAAFKGANKPSV